VKILFSPSETKRSGGEEAEWSLDSLLFGSNDSRKFIVEKYEQFLQNAKIEELSKLFGIKNLDDVKKTKELYFQKMMMPAIRRYDGVAYDYLDIATLDSHSLKYIEKNVTIFSNLYGSIGAFDPIPEYRLKQGETFEKLKIEQIYRDFFSSKLEALFEGEDILDLRAGFYEKFYKPSRDYLSMKFVKNGKVVSHFAKAFRGKFLREMAQNSIGTKKELMEHNFEGLQLIEIKKIAKKEEYLFEIIE